MRISDWSSDVCSSDLSRHARAQERRLTMFEAAVVAAAIIRRQIPEAPEVALVLGSGLAGVAEAVKQPVTLRYADLPGFPEPSVAGHGGSLSLGRLAGRPVAVMQGRAHYYESEIGRAHV